MSDAAYNELLARYRDVIEGIARKFAGPELDLFDDLVSVGMIALWELDTSKATRNVDAFIRNAIRNRLVDHLRWLDPERFDRLDEHLAGGAQVITDPETGEPRLTRSSHEDLGHGAHRRSQDSTESDDSAEA